MITHDDVSLLLFRSLLRKRWWWWCCRRRLAASRGSPLFRVRARRRHALSRFVFGYIYIKWNWKNAIEFVVSNSYSSRNALRRRILSLSPENKRDAFLVVVVVIDDDDDFVVFKGRFFFDTHIRCGRLRRPTELMSSSCSRVLLPTTTALEDHHNVVSFGGGGFGERSEGGRRRDETKRTTWTTL